MTSDPKIIQDYHAYLKLERGLSKNSIEGYMEDLRKLYDYCATNQKKILELQLPDFHQFASQLRDQGIAPRSLARVISGLKSFYRYLIIEEYIELDPTELLESPKIGFHLPEVLTIEEVNNLISAVPLDKKEGQRNKAMLEVLYSCGLRVSELIELKISNSYFEEGFLRVIGKGNKERIVPISPKAVKEIELYLYDRNLLDIKPGFEDILFLNRNGRQLTRMMIFHIIKELSESIGLKKNIGPHTFRHSFATHLLEGGANLRAIQMMLGHESISTTEIYTHIDRSYLRQEILLHHPRNAK